MLTYQDFKKLKNINETRDMVESNLTTTEVKKLWTWILDEERDEDIRGVMTTSDPLEFQEWIRGTFRDNSSYTLDSCTVWLTKNDWELMREEDWNTTIRHAYFDCKSHSNGGYNQIRIYLPDTVSLGIYRTLLSSLRKIDGGDGDS